MVLKAEIHCHIEGAAPPALVSKLAAKYCVDVSSIIKDDRYVWNDFSQFLNCYDVASSVFQAADDYRVLTRTYFEDLARQDCIYGEVFASADHAAEMGLSYIDLVSAMGDGLDAARETTGIEGRIIMTCVRHLGPERALAVARQTVDNPHPKVTGFGMGGDERAFAVAEFAPAFKLAKDAGLGLTAHGGEFGGPESVKHCLDHLGVTRIGHGVRSIEDATLVARLAEENIVLEVCPGSNIALGVYGDFEQHPFRALKDAGVKVTLNSDDPPYFHTDLTREYDIAHTHFGLDEAELSAITRAAIEAAFVDEETRNTLLTRLSGEGS